MNSPIRVLHVVVNMNRGGAETLIMNLYRNIDRSRIQFDFLTCKNGIFDAEIEEMGGKVHRIPYITEGGPFKYNKSLETFFSNHSEYKIVHSHMDKMSGFVLRAAKKSGIPVRIAHSHGTQSEGNVLSKGVKWLAGNKLLRNTSHYFACSQAASKWLFRQNSNHAILIKNGIDCQLFKQSPESRINFRNKLNIPENSFVLGHVGRFCTPKNHKFLIEIFKRVLLFNPQSILIMVGDGPLKDKIKKLVENSGLTNNIIFLGIQKNIHEILQAFDCMVFPSTHEGLPVTLVEAQSVGLPCLISNRITKEVDIGAGLVQYEDLKTSSIIWAIKVLLHDGSRRNVTAYVKENGFDINETAEWLQNFYMETINKLLSNRIA